MFSIGQIATYLPTGARVRIDKVYHDRHRARISMLDGMSDIVMWELDEIPWHSLQADPPVEAPAPPAPTAPAPTAPTPEAPLAPAPEEQPKPRRGLFSVPRGEETP